MTGGATTLTTSARAADPGWFRTTLGQYPTGVSVITAMDAEHTPIGMVVGSFSSVSLDPPLVAFMPMVSSRTWAQIRSIGRFCVNILAADQESICRAFSAKSGDKYAGVSWDPAPSGSPVLADAVAWIDCEIEAVHSAGDHDIVIGRVIDLDVRNPQLPLLFFQGGYGKFVPKSLAVRDARFGAELRLIDRARPLLEAAAAETGALALMAHCDGRQLTLLARAGSGDDPRVEPAIGQHVEVTAPIGIWWMAYAHPSHVDGWLAGVASKELRERYVVALSRIREAGYCLGLSTVHDEVSKALGDPGPASAPTRPQHVDSLVLDPLDYVPTRVNPADTAGAHPDIISLWAPTFQADGAVGMGVMLTGFAPDSPLGLYADRLRALAAAVTALSAA